MAEQTPLVRQWILLRTLCARHFGATVRELAEDLRVSQKTIRRDLETFQAVGFPVAETIEPRGRKRWRIEAAMNQPGMSFSFDEAIALYLGRRFLEPLAGTVFWDAAQRAFKKVRACLGPAALRYLEKFAAAFYQTALGQSDYAGKAELIDQLVQAMEERRIVGLTYQSLRATEPVSYDVYPYGLVSHRGALYLVGWAPDHQEIRHWKVARIAAVELSGLRFNPPEDFDLAAHMAKSFGVIHGEGEVHVKIRFSPTVARYVQEGRWHTSQRLTPEKDGRLLAEFDLDGTEEIKRWILSFGQHAEMLEPGEVRKEIVDELKRTINQYSKAAGADGGSAEVSTPLLR